MEGTPKAGVLGHWKSDGQTRPGAVKSYVPGLNYCTWNDREQQELWALDGISIFHLRGR